MDLQTKYIVDINDFNMIQKISEGGFGKVFIVQDKKTKERFAAKTATKNTEEDIVLTKREIKALSYFNHPTIIKFKGYSLTDFLGAKNLTILMELASNGSLQEVLTKRRQGLSPDGYDNTSKQKILIGIARGMMLLHKNRLIHRDLKPDNILLDENFQPLITDFGLSKFYEVGKSMNQTGIRGTYTYMAPEILASSNKYNTKADVFSFGIIMFQVVTDQDPYPDVTNRKISDVKLAQLVSEKNYRPKFDFPIKNSIKKLIEKCWEQDPNERPTFEQIFNALAYDFDDFMLTNDDEDDDEVLDDGLNKYFLSDDVDGDAVEDYLEIISKENVIDSDFSVDNKEELKKELQLIVEKMNSIEKSNAELKETNTRILNENKKILKKCSSLEKKLNEKTTEIENLKSLLNENKNLISSLQKENKKMKNNLVPNELLERIDKNDEQIELLKKVTKDFDQDHQSIQLLKNDVIQLKSISSLKSFDGKTISDDVLAQIQSIQKMIDDFKKDHQCIRCLKFEVHQLKNNSNLKSTIGDPNDQKDLLNRLETTEENVKQLRDDFGEIKHKVGGIKHEVKKLKKQ